MKQIFSISFFIVLLSASCVLNAQTKKMAQKKKPTITLDSLILKKLTYRFEIGYNNPSQYSSTSSATYFNGIKTGLTAEYDLKNNFSLLSGVLYNLVYSDKLQNYPNSTYVNYVTYGHFINIPVHFQYNLPVSKDLKFFGFAGPTLNIGLQQVQSTVSSYHPTNSVYDIPSAYKNLYISNLNQIDLQIGIGAGVQFKNYQLKGGYDFGVLNINKLSSGNLYQKGWYVTVAIKL
jgi:hypothetical protein